jgi:hypothetical protein
VQIKPGVLQRQQRQRVGNLSGRDKRKNAAAVDFGATMDLSGRKYPGVGVHGG